MSLPEKLILPHLFDILGEKVPELEGLAGKAAELDRKVGKSEYALLRSEKPQLSTGEMPFTVFDQRVVFSADLAATLLIHKAGSEVAIFETDEELEKLAPFEKLIAPEGSSLAELSIRGSAGASTSLEFPVKPFTLSAHAAASRGIRYRHFLPARASRKRFPVFRDLLATARLPQAVLNEAPKLEAGEVQVLEAWLRLGFGVGAGTSGEGLLNRVVDLFDGLSPEVKAHVKYSFEASLGWSLYDLMQLAVGSWDVEKAGWARVRLQRRRRKELTLGAKLDLQVSYDLGTKALLDFLERTFDLVPTPRLLDSLRELDRIFQEGGAEGVKKHLSAKAVEAIGEFLDDKGWVQKLAGSDEIGKILDWSSKIIAEYEKLDARVQDLWSTFLASARLGPGSKARRVLQTIAELEGKKVEEVLDDLISGELKQALELIESLGGEDLVGLVVSDAGTAQRALDGAARRARQAIDFLDQVPEEFLERLHAFAERTGIAGTVEFLSKNLGSPAQLQQAANERIRTLVEQLLGKALEKIDNDDIAKLAGWSRKVLDAFDRVDEFEAEIRKAISKLKGEIGFSFAVEISRVSERAAVVDIEIDATRKKLREAIDRALRSGDAESLLQALPEPEKLDEREEPPYRLRESIFMARRIRSGSFSSFISIFGKTKRRTSRIDSETVRVRQVGNGLRRFGTYRGGLVRTVLAEGDKVTANGAELGIWWRTTASGPGSSLADRYSKIEEQGLRLSFTRRDHKTLSPELEAIDALLEDLGFLDGGGPKAVSLPGPSVQTQLAIELRLEAAGLAAFLRKEGTTRGWNRDFRNAAIRSFQDGLIPEAYAGPHSGEVRLGEVLADLVQKKVFVESWTDFTGFLGAVKNRPWSVDLAGDRSARGRWTLVQGSQRIPRFVQLTELIRRRRRGFSATQRAAEQHESLGARPLPVNLRRTARQFGNAMGRSVQKRWDLPLFLVWLVAARLARADPESLETARGIAVLRWRPQSAETWEEPLVWRLEDGIPAHGEETIFPA